MKYLVLYSFDIVNGEIIDKTIIIDYQKFKSFEAWQKIRNSTDTLPKKYGIAQKEPYIKGSKKDLTKNYSRNLLDILGDFFEGISIFFAQKKTKNEIKKWNEL